MANLARTGAAGLKPSKPGDDFLHKIGAKFMIENPRQFRMYY